MDNADFENLIDAYGKGLYSFCGHLTGYSDEANDLYQQTFLRAFEIRDRIHMDGNPRAFLFSIAAKLYKSGIRKSARRERIAPREDITEENSELLASGENVEENVISREQRAVLREAVGRLREPYRVTVLLYYGSGFPEEEISRILRIPKGTVKSRLNKARTILRTDLEASGYAKA